jgi:hypothetical protein
VKEEDERLALPQQTIALNRFCYHSLGGTRPPGSACVCVFWGWGPGARTAGPSVRQLRFLLGPQRHLPVRGPIDCLMSQAFDQLPFLTI